MIQIGIHAIISIIIYLLAIGLSFQAIKALKIEQYTIKGKIFETQLLYIFLSIALGYLVGTFVISFIDASMQLSNFF